MIYEPLLCKWAKFIINYILGENTQTQGINSTVIASTPPMASPIILYTLLGQISLISSQNRDLFITVLPRTMAKPTNHFCESLLLVKEALFLLTFSSETSVKHACNRWRVHVSTCQVRSIQDHWVVFKSVALKKWISSHAHNTAVLFFKNLKRKEYFLHWSRDHTTPYGYLMVTRKY